MTPEQEKALAIARARRRRAEAQQGGRRPAGSGNAFSAATRGIGDAFTFGFADELAAGAYAPFGAAIDAVRGRGFDLGAAYRRQIERERAADAADEANHPIARIAGQLAGGVGVGAALTPVSMSGRLASGARIGSRVAAGAGDAAVAGALYGAGSGTDMQSRAGGAAMGAGLGGALGAAFPIAGVGAGAAVQAARNAALVRPLAQKAGIRPDTARLLSGVLSADDSLGAGGQARMAAAGQEAMLADAGPTAQGILDAAIQRGGPGARMASERIGARAGRDAQALGSALDQSLGRPQGITAARSQIRQGSQAARQQAYDAAYSKPINYTGELGREIEDIMQNRVPQSVISRANALMRAEGNQSQQILARIGDDGNIVYERLPDVRQLDYITRALNDLAEAGEGAGALGGVNALGRAYQNLSRDIRSNMRKLVPEYAEALETAADPIRRSKAVELGGKILGNRMTRDQVAEAVQGMTGPERDALAQGVRSQIDDAMARVQRTLTDPNTDAREAVAALKRLSSRDAREKLAIALGEERVAPMFAELDRAARSFDLRAGVATNSRTFGRQAINERVAQMTEPNALDMLLRGEPLQAGKQVAQTLTGRTAAARAATQDQIFAEIADLLTRQGGAGEAAYGAASSVGRVDAQTQAIVDAMRRIAASSGISYPATSQLQRLTQ